MKPLIFLSAFLLFVAAGCSNEAGTSKTTTVTDTSKIVKKDTTEGVNVSLKGNTSVDIGSDEGAVQTKTGTSVQVNEKGNSFKK